MREQPESDRPWKWLRPAIIAIGVVYAVVAGAVWAAIRSGIAACGAPCSGGAVSGVALWLSLAIAALFLGGVGVSVAALHARYRSRSHRVG